MVNLSGSTILHLLGIIGVEEGTFANLGSTKDEFSAIKSVYMKKALRTHPDKGGDEAEFRELQEAWETIRGAFEADEVPPEGFGSFFKGEGKNAKASKAHFRARGEAMPSWEWFSAAAEERVVPYRVELAKTGRAKCAAKTVKIAMKHAKGEVIEKGTIRCGSMDEESGAYSRWFHLECWRVPSLIWLGLPATKDPAAYHEALMNMQQIALCGYAELSTSDQRAVVEHLMDESSWAKATKNSKPEHEEAFAAGTTGRGSKAGGAGGGGGGVAQIDAGASSSALVAPGGAPRQFIAPRPGQNGAVANSLVKKTFVLTGLFPEVGGGTGLNLGKDRLKDIIESFGGKVTSSVSGKTDYVVVGQEPGAKKVSEARNRGIKQIDVLGLKTALETPGMALEACPEPRIDSFSAGYYGSALRVTDGYEKKPRAKAIKAPKVPTEKKPRAKKAPAKRKAKDEYDDDDDDEEEEDIKAKKIPRKKAPPKKKAKKIEYEDDDDDDY